VASGTPALKVRGVCPTCKRVVDATAPKGRSTWTGPCPAKDCGGKVVARRLAPGAEPAAQPTDAPPGEPESTPRKPRARPIKKVTGYARPTEAQPLPSTPRPTNMMPMFAQPPPRRRIRLRQATAPASSCRSCPRRTGRAWGKPSASG